MTSLERRIARQRGEMLTRIVNVPISLDATEEATGEVVGKTALGARVRILAGIVRGGAQGRIEEVFSARRAEEMTASGLASQIGRAHV